MDTTHNDIPMLISDLNSRRAMLDAGHLQMQQSIDEVEDEIDWLYARLLWHGMTPDQIEAATQAA